MAYNKKKRFRVWKKKERGNMGIWNDLMVVAGSVLTLFLMMAVGFVLTKKRMLGTQTLSQMSQLLLKVVAPCVVISSLQVDFSAGLLKTMAVALAVIAATYVLYGILVHLLFKKQQEATRASLRFGTMFGNIGFMGLPLIQSVLGQEATIFCVMSLAIFNVSNWTYGVALMGDRISVKKAVLNPGVLSLAAGVLLFVLQIRLPAPVLSAVEYMGSLNTPLAMVVIGGQMAGADLLATFREKRLYGAALVKLVLMPLLTLAALLPFHLDRLMFLTIVILSGCPTAGATSMFAQMFGKDTATAARMVTLSTLLSILTLPLVALAARQFGG